MINQIMASLSEYWEVEHRPKKSLSKDKDEYLVDLQFANIFYIVVTISLLTVTVLFIGGGML